MSLRLEFLKDFYSKMVDGFASTDLRKKRIVQVTWLVQCALVASSFHPILTEHWFNLCLLAIFFVAFWFCRKTALAGNLNLSSNLISIFLTLLILFLCWFNQGIRDEVLLVFPALITFAALTGTQKFLWGIYALIACSVMTMGLINEVGLYQHYISGAGLESAIIIIIIMSVVTYSIKILAADLTSANEKLVNHKQKLEEEFEIRAAVLRQSLEDLTEAKNELVEAEKMASLGRLVAGVAHEVNTPLGIAITASSLIQEGTEKFKKQLSSNEVTKSRLTQYVDNNEQSIEMIQGNLKRAANLVSNFKQVSVLQSDERTKVFNFHEMLKTIIHQNKALHVDKNVKTTISGDKNIFIEQDPDVITRIFTNLYENSCKHGFPDKSHGNVNIDIHQSAEVIKVRYTDDGTGIPEENVPQIFEPFFTTKRGYGGTGLGMHIVFNLVTQSLKGHIKYNETYKKGACFEISFQMA